MPDPSVVPDERLKPCPFCGSPAMVTKSTNTDWYGHWMVCCDADDDACPVDPYLFGGREPEDKQPAIDRWNRRSPLDGRRALEVVEALRWLTHVVNGVGKGGGRPEDGEEAAANEAAQTALNNWDSLQSPVPAGGDEVPPSAEADPGNGSGAIGWQSVATLPPTDGENAKSAWGDHLPALFFSPKLGVVSGTFHRLHSGEPHVGISSFHGNAITDWGVTHWMPLPEEPK